jgi:hypothetical protein
MFIHFMHFIGSSEALLFFYFYEAPFLVFPDPMTLQLNDPMLL